MFYSSHKQETHPGRKGKCKIRDKGNTLTDRKIEEKKSRETKINTHMQTDTDLGWSDDHNSRRNEKKEERERDKQTDRPTLRRKAFILKDIETVLFAAAAGVELLSFSMIIGCLEKSHVILKRVAQVIAVTTSQKMQTSQGACKKEIQTVCLVCKTVFH